MEKYTVVIPARNNVETLRYTLATCLRQQYPNFYILVSDNCSEDGTGDMIQGLNDSRISYIRTPRTLSMTQHFEFALSHVKDGFVMCIGADDGLMPDSINYVDAIVQKHNVKAVACQYAHYFWPNVPVAEHGKLTVNGMDVHKTGVEIRRSPEWIQKTLNFESVLYVCDLPSVYYGFIHRSIIDKCVKDGVYFRSITPDAYSAFATAIQLDNYAYSQRPFCIAGISGKSNGLSQMLNGDVAKRFITENVHPIHHEFAFSPAFEVILAEAFYQLKDAFPRECAPYKIDMALMLQKAVANSNQKTAEEVLTAARKMAEMHQINFEQVKDSKLKKLNRFYRLTSRMTRSFITNRKWYLGMADSAKFSVRNIDEASTVLGVFVAANEGNEFETIESRFTGRIKKRLGLKK